MLSGSPAKKMLVVHGTILHDYSISKLQLFMRKNVMIPYLYKKADCVVAVSEGIKAELKSYGHLKNVVAIPNAFDVAGIQAKSSQPLSSEWDAIFSKSEVLITSGRLHVQKKQRYLLPVFKSLKQQRSGVKLVILGDGALRDALLKEAEGLGLSCYTAWETTSKLTDAYDVYNPFQFLSRSRLFLFPSAWEGFPLALCEALICGVPVLSSDCPTGPREIIAPGTLDAEYGLRAVENAAYGVLLPMPDKVEFERCWTEAIQTLLENEVMRETLILKGKERMQDFEESVISKKWLHLIERVSKSSL
jgi:glycosyltransferase involved in cell wall biosynthesis